MSTSPVTLKSLTLRLFTEDTPTSQWNVFSNKLTQHQNPGKKLLVLFPETAPAAEDVGVVLPLLDSYSTEPPLLPPVGIFVSLFRLSRKFFNDSMRFNFCYSLQSNISEIFFHGRKKLTLFHIFMFLFSA